MIRYLPFREDLSHEDLGLYTTFGIRAVDAKGRVLLNISDVSTNEQAVRQLCDRCTRGRLALAHLMDVIEDELPLF